MYQEEKVWFGIVKCIKLHSISSSGWLAQLLPTRTNANVWATVLQWIHMRPVPESFGGLGDPEPAGRREGFHLKVESAEL